nr:hypothetical protein [Fodinicola feengrottensis]
MSETTLLRYFPTKQSLVLWDDFGTGIAAVFRAQPTDLRPVSALRATFHQVFGAAITQTQRADVRARVALLLSAPPLRSLLLDELHGPAQLMRELIAERTGAEPDDLPTRTLGAVIGRRLAVRALRRRTRSVRRHPYSPGRRDGRARASRLKDFSIAAKPTETLHRRRRDARPAPSLIRDPGRPRLARGRTAIFLCGPHGRRTRR